MKLKFSFDIFFFFFKKINFYAIRETKFSKISVKDFSSRCVWNHGESIRNFCTK